MQPGASLPPVPHGLDLGLQGGDIVEAQQQQPQQPLNKLPSYAIPLIVGLAIIAVFCLILGIIIITPHSKQREAMKEQAERRRRAQNR